MSFCPQSRHGGWCGALAAPGVIHPAGSTTLVVSHHRAFIGILCSRERCIIYTSNLLQPGNYGLQSADSTPHYRPDCKQSQVRSEETPSETSVNVADGSRAHVCTHSARAHSKRACTAEQTSMTSMTRRARHTKVAGDGSEENISQPVWD